MAVKNCFIRGSVVRYVQLPAQHVDTQLLEDATRRGASSDLLCFEYVHLTDQTSLIQRLRPSQNDRTRIWFISSYITLLFFSL